MSDYLFINQNGATYCAKHGGHYLESELKDAQPIPATILTPLDHWMSFSPESIAEYATHGDVLECETCEAV